MTSPIMARKFRSEQKKKSVTSKKRSAILGITWRSVQWRGSTHFALQIEGSEHVNVLAIVQMMAVEADEKECKGIVTYYVLTD